MNNPPSNKDFISDLFRRIEADGDWNTLFEALSDDIVWTVTGTSPVTGVFKGKQACVEGLILPVQKTMAEPFRCQIQRILVEGDAAVVLWKGSSTTKTGLPYRQEYCWILELKDRKIVSVRAFFDTLLATMALLSCKEGHPAYAAQDARP
ncbi:MAG TPA: nuclear transport factor 2 family protein [bacterium]|nr:nuclear transport factor 2 family protein [bacterium]